MRQNESHPLISVLMGVYYRKKNIKLLQRSISSILAQSFADFELLICDDGSTSEAHQLIDQFAQKDNRIKVIRQNKLFSLPEKLNECLRQARGRLIARMDDDDYAYPERFQEQKNLLEARPEIAFVGSNVVLNHNGFIIGERRMPEFPAVKDFLFVQPYVHPALMFRCETLELVGGYSEDRHCAKCEDYDLLLRLYESGFKGCNLQNCLLEYTISADGNRNIIDRWNEALVRYQHFSTLNMLPKALPYVVKPVLVGLLPRPMLWKIKTYIAQKEECSK